jgi:hypothetical protein
MLVVDFPGGGHLSIEFVPEAPDADRPRLGAWLELREGRSCCAAEVVRETNRLLGAHEQITGYTVWPEEDFPRTPILKVDRKLVRAAVGRRQSIAAGLRPPAPPGR